MIHIYRNASEPASTPQAKNTRKPAHTFDLSLSNLAKSFATLLIIAGAMFLYHSLYSQLMPIPGIIATHPGFLSLPTLNLPTYFGLGILALGICLHYATASAQQSILHPMQALASLKIIIGVALPCLIFTPHLPALGLLALPLLAKLPVINETLHNAKNSLTTGDSTLRSDSPVQNKTGLTTV